MKLVERVLSEQKAGGDTGDGPSEADLEEINALVDAVQGHARTPALRDHGVEGTRTSLVELMAAMHEHFPAAGSGRCSPTSSTRCNASRRRTTRAPVLGVFHGAVDLDALRLMME